MIKKKESKMKIKKKFDHACAFLAAPVTD